MYVQYVYVYVYVYMYVQYVYVYVYVYVYEYEYEYEYVYCMQALMQLNNTLGCCLVEVLQALVDSGYVLSS